MVFARRLVSRLLPPRRLRTTVPSPLSLCLLGLRHLPFTPTSHFHSSTTKTSCFLGDVERSFDGNPTTNTKFFRGLCNFAQRRLGGFRGFSHGTVDLVISDGKPKFETREFDPPKKDKWLNKKRFKMKRMREKKKRKEANSRDPRCLRQKGKKKKKPRFPNAEARLLYKIEKARIKEGLLIEKLKRYSVSKLQGPMTKPEILSGEERFYMKKMAQKRSNYVPVGRRGVFGGVILNMHLHWKKHETVKVICKPCKPGGQVHEFAREIARLSGGTPIQIIGDDSIVFYRGKNYAQPEVMSPIDTLSKKRALEKSKYEQSLETVRHFIQISEKELELYYRHIALYGGHSVAEPKVEESNQTHQSINTDDLESDSIDDDDDECNEEFDSAGGEEIDCEMAETDDEDGGDFEDKEEFELDSKIL